MALRNGRFHLRVGANDYDPVSIVTTDSEGNLQVLGLAGKLLSLLSSAGNFTYSLFKPPDNLWGSKEANGSWTGLFGMMQKNELDMIAFPYSFTAERSEVFGYTECMIADSKMILSKQYTVLDEERDVLDQLFMGAKWQLLLCVAVSLVGLPGVVIVLERMVTKVIKKHSSFSTGQRTKSEVGTFFSSLLDRAIRWKPSSVSARFALGMYLLFSVLLASYTGNIITSDKVVKIPRKSVDSLEELLEGKIQPSVTKGTSESVLLKTSKIQVYQKVWAKITSDSSNIISADRTHRSNRMLKQEIVTGKKAYINGRIYLLPLAREICEEYKGVKLHFSRGSFYPACRMFPVHKKLNPAIKHRILETLSALIEGGLVKKILQDSIPTPEACLDPVPLSTRHVPVGRLESFQKTFYVIICGWFLGILFCSAEVTWWNRHYLLHSSKLRRKRLPILTVFRLRKGNQLNKTKS